MNDELNTAIDNTQQPCEQLFESDELYETITDIIDGEEYTFVVYRGILDITTGDNDENI